ncbi:MAG: adenylosuccinate lyase [Spirochaetales bacterium]|nr:adenylosuccinate lyase [Spirochaetales bacterium]
MPVDHSVYENPLISRYAGREMSALFSDRFKFSTWRRLWIALAEAQAELGLGIPAQGLEEMRAHWEDIDFELQAAKEKELRHDVMAAVLCYGEQCPSARGIIHLGATSCFVTDNTELLQIFEALKIVRRRLAGAILLLARLAREHRELACLGYTHFQPAQPTTLGKRATLWLQDLLISWEDLEALLARWRLRGAKGATGTQDSYLKLFDGDHEKVRALDRMVCRKLGFKGSFPVTGQTYTRLWDSKVLDLLKNIALSAHKFAVDFRLMQHLKMVDEPFESRQVGSSAMAYKRNPMRCERLCSLARSVMSQVQAADQTAATQWFERTLDDSAGRRLYIPQAFLGVDALLAIYANVLGGLKVYPRVIDRLLREELPFLATETILMRGVLQGGDRQALHEAIREKAVEAAREIKEEGAPNRLFEKLAADPRVPFALEELEEIAAGSDFCGRAPSQVDEFLAAHIEPLLPVLEAADAPGGLRV